MTLPKTAVSPKKNILEEAFKNLVTGRKGELDGYIEMVVEDVPLDHTKSKAYCHFLKLDGNGNVRLEDFIIFLTEKIIDFTIPRSKIKDAYEYHTNTGSPARTVRLLNKAKNLFTKLKSTGEGGELLLYVLANELLQLPQLLCKMPLKTNSKLHVNGVDGIHAKYFASTDTLALYLGESKMKQSFATAVKECFESLAPFLLSNGGSKSPLDRDIQLIQDNLDLADEELQEAILRYFDKDDPLSSKVEFRGVCFIGFDYKKYPSLPRETTTQELKDEILSKVTSWKNSVCNSIQSHKNLDRFDIHVFLMPFPSVQDFRDKFLETLGL